MNTATLEKPESVTVVTGRLGELVAALEFARYAMLHPKSVVRKYMCGVRLDINSAGLHVMAADGHRLHCTVLPYKLESRETFNFLLKAADVSTILKTWGTKRSQKDHTFTIDYPTGQIFIVHNTSVGKAVDASFDHWSGIDGEAWEPGLLPDYGRVIPRDCERVFVCWGDQMLGFLNAACGAEACAFKIEANARPATEAGNVILSAAAHVRVVRGRDSYVTIKQDGIKGAEVSKSIEAGYSASYVRDIIRAFGTRCMLVYEANDHTSPALWHAGAKAEQFVVLMPMRV